MLVVAVDREIYGTLTDGTGSIVPREKAGAATYDVLDEVVGLTLRQGGEVIGAKGKELPEGIPDRGYLPLRSVIADSARAILTQENAMQSRSTPMMTSKAATNSPIRSRPRSTLR